MFDLNCIDCVKAFIFRNKRIILQSGAIVHQIRSSCAESLLVLMFECAGGLPTQCKAPLPGKTAKIDFAKFILDSQFNKSGIA